MNLQLKNILNILNNRKLNYWIDSGTLLGLIREKNLLKNDKDIDIGLHIRELDKFISIIPKINALGYRSRYELYNEIPSKYKFYPKNKNFNRTIDLNIYREKEEDYLWCPVTCFKEPANIFDKKYQKMIKYFWRRIFQKIETNKFPYTNVKNTYSWIIPIKYYKKIIYNNNFCCNMFEEFNSYLEYRYGTWEIPNQDWDLFRDDGGIIKKTPENLEKRT